MEIVPLGDSALIVRVREQFDDAPEETLNEVLRTFQQLRSAAIPGVIEVAPAYTSVAVFFDPVDVAKASGTASDIFDWLSQFPSAEGAAVPRRELLKFQSATIQSSRPTSTRWRVMHRFRQSKL